MVSVERYYHEGVSAPYRGEKYSHLMHLLSQERRDLRFVICGIMAEMTEKDAAAYLNVSVRTLGNCRQKGTLPYREVKGKTRPAIEYEKADIERLKAQLEARRSRSRKPTPVRSAPRVAFGIPPGRIRRTGKGGP